MNKYSATVKHGLKNVEATITVTSGSEKVTVKVTMTNVEDAAIESVEAENDAPAHYFDLQGRAVADPQGGVFIKRQGAKTTKVIR